MLLLKVPGRKTTSTLLRGLPLRRLGVLVTVLSNSKYCRSSL